MLSFPFGLFIYLFVGISFLTFPRIPRLTRLIRRGRGKTRKKWERNGGRDIWVDSNGPENPLSRRTGGGFLRFSSPFDTKTHRKEIKNRSRGWFSPSLFFFFSFFNVFFWSSYSLLKSRVEKVIYDSGITKAFGFCCALEVGNMSAFLCSSF